ncbi:MAG TPA: Clp1/GlmU family protein [Candidatus Binatia bacterium]|nr:Clp1/GlmU family protein [Candidatus Binatia bacterium]
MVIGPGDVGKSTLAAALASALHAEGREVGVVDADVGQSALGPPTTVALGRVRRPLARLGEADLLAMHFVGVTSPAANLMGTVVGAGRMVQRARALGLERVVVDTSGLVVGDLGRALKQAKIDLLAPDLIVALQRAGECEPILRPWHSASRPRIVRLAPTAAARVRRAEERRRYREDALAAYFAGAQRRTLDLTRVVLRWPALFLGAPLPEALVAAGAEAIGQPLLWAEHRNGEVAVLAAGALAPVQARALATLFGAGPVTAYAREELIDALAGLHDADGETLGLGVVRAITTAPPSLEIVSPVKGAPAAVTIGRARWRSG